MKRKEIETQKVGYEKKKKKKRRWLSIILFRVTLNLQKFLLAVKLKETLVDRFVKVFAGRQ